MNKIKLKTLSDRLLYALEITGIKKADLARTVGVQPQTIQHLCYGGVKASRFTFELATALGLSTTWLATGEGRPFVSDDPKTLFSRDYKITPILNSNQLMLLAMNNDFEINGIEDSVLLKTIEPDVFCVIMDDVSMSPILPKNSKVFFKKITKKQVSSGIVIAYLPSLDSILIRNFFIKNKEVFLSPKNKILFKEIELPEDAIIFGLAIECHFSIEKL